MQNPVTRIGIPYACNCHESVSSHCREIEDGYQVKDQYRSLSLFLSDMPHACENHRSVARARAYIRTAGASRSGARWLRLAAICLAVPIHTEDLHRGVGGGGGGAHGCRPGRIEYVQWGADGDPKVVTGPERSGLRWLLLCARWWAELDVRLDGAGAASHGRLLRRGSGAPGSRRRVQGRGAHSRVSAPRVPVRWDSPRSLRARRS